MINVLISICFAIIVTLSIVLPLQRQRLIKANESFRNNFERKKDIPIETNRDLFNLYYHGINDEYDANGEKLQGFEPEPMQAIQVLQQIIQDEQRPEDQLQLAQIYEQGMHGLQPQPEMARGIYMELLNNVPDFQIRNRAREGLQNTIRDVFRQPIDDDQEDALFQLDMNRAILNSLTPEFNLIGTHRRNDSQNTHNTGVVQTVKHSVKKIENTPMIKNINQVVREIREYIDNQPTSTKKNDAIKSLGDIMKSTTTVQTGKTLPETMALVWNRIHDPINQTHCENLKSNLYNNLAEMQEHGSTVCSTGISNKLVDTLNKIDPEVEIKPMYALNEEMLNKSAHIRNQFLDTLSGIDKQSFELGTHQHQSDLDNQLKHEIINGLSKDYVDTGIMSQQRLKAEISKWIDHI